MVFSAFASVRYYFASDRHVASFSILSRQRTLNDSAWRRGGVFLPRLVAYWTGAFASHTIDGNSLTLHIYTGKSFFAQLFRSNLQKPPLAMLLQQQKFNIRSNLDKHPFLIMNPNQPTETSANASKEIPESQSGFNKVFQKYSAFTQWADSSSDDDLFVGGNVDVSSDIPY